MVTKPKKGSQNSGDDEEEEKPSGFWAFLGRMWDNFGFFDMLFMGLVIGGLYLAAKANPDFVQSLVEKLPDSWQANVAGALNWLGIDVDMGKMLDDMADKDLPDLKRKMVDKGVPADVVEVIAKDKETFHGFLNIVREANGSGGVKGKVTMTTMTNDKTIFVLVRDHAAFARDIAIAALKPGANGATSKTAKEITESLKQIINSPRLDELFDTAHRTNTLALLKDIALAKGADPKTIDAHIEGLLSIGLGPDGKPNDTMRRALTGILTPGADGKPQAPEQAVIAAASQDPAATKALIDGYIASKSEPQKQALTALRGVLGDDKIKLLMTSLTPDKDMKEALGIALSPDYIQALPQFIDVLKTSQEPKAVALVQSLPFKLETLPALVKATGLGADGKPNALLTKLTADLTQLPELSVSAVMKPLQDYASSPEILRNPAASAAVLTFLNGMDVSKLTPDQQKKLDDAKSLFAAPPEKREAAMRVETRAQTAGIPIEDVRNKFYVMENGVRKEFSPAKTLDALLDAPTRAQIRTLGTADLATLMSSDVRFLNQKNFDALLKFCDRLEAANKEDPARAKKILNIAVRMMNGAETPAALVGITKQDVSGFFRIRGNYDAFVALKNDADLSVLEPKPRKIAEGLYNLIGDYSTGGLVNLLATDEGADLLLDQARSGSSIHMPKLVQNMFLSWKGGSIAQNAGTLTRLGTLLDETSVTSSLPRKSSFGTGLMFN